MRVILPPLMHDVHAYTRRGVPLTRARTRCTFGSQRRLFRLCEKVTALPKNGFLPQMSQTAAIDRRGYQTASRFDRGEVLVERALRELAVDLRDLLPVCVEEDGHREAKALELVPDRSVGVEQ